MVVAMCGRVSPARNKAVTLLDPDNFFDWDYVCLDVNYTFKGIDYFDIDQSEVDKLVDSIATDDLLRNSQCVLQGCCTHDLLLDAVKEHCQCLQRRLQAFSDAVMGYEECNFFVGDAEDEDWPRWH